MPASRSASLLVKLLGRAPGQRFLAVTEQQLRHPLDKYTTARLFDAIGNYFAPARYGEAREDIACALAQAELWRHRARKISAPC